MICLYVIDYFLSFALGFAICNITKCEDYIFVSWILILIIISGLRKHEAKVKGRLKIIERKEFLKYFDDYDNYVYIVNNKVDKQQNIDTL